MTVISSTVSGSFKGLVDTPSSYSGQSGNVVSVKSTEDGVEFTSASAVSVNFGYYNVTTNLTIPANQNMFTYQTLTIASGVTLTVNGRSVIRD